MKKASTQYLRLMPLGLLLAFFVPFFANAQTGIVIVSQGIQSAKSSQAAYFPQNAGQVIYNIDIGTGWNGTTTGAYAGFNGTVLDQSSAAVLWVQLFAYSDQALTTQVGDCSFDSSALANPTIVALGFLQATTLFNVSGSGCAFDPTLYYKVRITYTFIPTAGYYTQNVSPGFVYRGSPTNVRPSWTTTGTYQNEIYIPMFVLVGGGFEITPTVNDTGLSLSGAKAFCDAQFASSSPLDVASGISHGFCVVGGYLFVPTATSTQQFASLLPTLETKIPFSYAFDLVGVYQSLVASSTSNFQNFAITLPAFGSSTALGTVIPTTVPIISTTTVSTYFPDPIRTSFLFLASLAIWGEVIFVVYRRIIPRHVTHT